MIGFYQNRREYVLSFGLFKTLDPEALAKGRIVVRDEFKGMR